MTSAIRASGRSTLLTTRITGSFDSSALRRTKRVCGSGPSEASTRSSTPSTMVSARSTSPPKSACPGVSTMFSLTPPWLTAVFLARIVIPFSRSRSIESITRSATSCPLRKVPVCHSIASTSVVLPWSTWAMIAMFRRSSRVLVMRVEEGRQSGRSRQPAPAWVQAKRSPLESGLRDRSEERYALSSLLDARGGRALGAFFGLVTHFGPLGEALEALTQDRAVMDENVLRAVIGRNEPVALVVAEPLDSSGRHALPPLRVLRTQRMHGSNDCERYAQTSPVIP